jgi:peptidoglycan/xylan/chitin deacetylase (PgdA/CDA1 family)
LKTKTISFLYHEVTDQPEKSGFQRLGALPYKHAISHFKSDLKIILNHFMRSEVVTNLPQNIGNTSLILTFDDGGLSALDIAEILMERKLIGHFFVTTSMIGSPEFLNVEQIKSIRKKGHLIGAHSHSHPSIFRDLTYKEKLYEWKKSKEVLEKILNEKVCTASVPGGDIDDDTIRSAGEVGLTVLFTSEPHFTSYQKFGVQVFGRVCPKNTTTESQIEKWATGKGFYKARLVRLAKEVFRVRLKFLYKIYIKRNEAKL